MHEITIIQDQEQKSRICEEVLRDLKPWFEVEAPLLDYIENVKDKLFVAAFENEAVLGFICIEEVKELVSEIYVMGVKQAAHRQGVGRELLKFIEQILVKQGQKYLLVKTLSDRRPDEQYDKTKQFYLKSGFVPLYELDIWGEENPCVLMIKQL